MVLIDVEMQELRVVLNVEGHVSITSLASRHLHTPDTWKPYTFLSSKQHHSSPGIIVT